MSINLLERGVRTVLLDIEGTTTPIAFVHETLFPYARRRLRACILEDAMSSPGRAWIDQLHAEWRAEPPGADALPEWKGNTVDEVAASALAYCEWLMDRDRKSPALKEIQGLIWKAGYEAGELTSQLFPDVPAAFERWRRAGIQIAIYSSGSVLAQRLLFGASNGGNLRSSIGQFFDTGVGAKTSSASYGRIADSLRCTPREILFVSDVIEELDAARQAGLGAVLSIRPGNPPQTITTSVESITSLDELTASPVAG